MQPRPWTVTSTYACILYIIELYNKVILYKNINDQNDTLIGPLLLTEVNWHEDMHM